MRLFVMGDPHGLIDLEEDSYWLSQVDRALCTGDFAYQVQGREHSLACEILKTFCQLKVGTILGNHDGICHHPSLIYRPGETEPSSQRELAEALGPYYLGYRRLDFEDFSVVGGRPFSNGNPGIQHPPWGHEDFTLEQSAAKILELIQESPHQALVLLSHNGPRGLGSERDSPYGRDWKTPPLDWGDEDLARVLENIPSNKKMMAVITGHMHHRLRGGGLRQRVAFFRGIPVVNAAVVPRVVKKGVIQTRPFKGEIQEKKVFQEHRHFLELEFDTNKSTLIYTGDFWARRGSRQNEGIRCPLWSFEASTVKIL